MLEFEKAIEKFEKVLQIDPKNIPAHDMMTMLSKKPIK